MPRPLPPTLLALTFATGLVDATAFLGLGGVFVGNMTGNVVFFGIALTGAGLVRTEATLVAIAAFVVGAAMAGRLRLIRGGSSVHAMRRLLVLETLFVAAAAALGLAVGVDSEAQRLAIVSVLAIAMGLQNATVHALAIPDLTTTVLTQQLSGIGSDPWEGDARAARLVRRASAIAAMLAGAVAAALLIRVSVELALAVGLAAVLASALTFAVLTRGRTVAES